MATFIGLQKFYKILDRDLDPRQDEAGHFNIFKVEDLPAHSPARNTYTRRDFFKVSLVTGHSKIYYADRCYEVNGSVLVFTNPMIPYYWERISEKHTGYVCIFNEFFFAGFGKVGEYPIFNISGAAVVPLTEAEASFYYQQFARMEEELKGAYAYKFDLLRSILMNIIHTAQKMQPAIGKPYSDANAAGRITELFAELLDRQFPVEVKGRAVRLHTPSAFAKQLNVHVNHLNKALKQTSGRTTSQWINDRLVEEARILLKSADWTINDIAWSLGFQEPNHFSTWFKTRTGINPKKFREAKID